MRVVLKIRINSPNQSQARTYALVGHCELDSETLVNLS